jgi:hypothetical protein
VAKPMATALIAEPSRAGIAYLVRLLTRERTARSDK